MFDIAWSEMLLIAVIAIIVVGPRDLPKLMTGVGRIVGKLRKMAREFQGGMTQLARESEIDEITQIHNFKNTTGTQNMIKNAIDPDGVFEDPVFPDPKFDGSKPDKGDPPVKKEQKPKSVSKTITPKVKAVKKPTKAKGTPKPKAKAETKPKGPITKKQDAKAKGKGASE